MYLSHFGFREPPFSVTPNPKFLYSNPAYEEAFANLRYGIEGRKGFIVLTGEVGTGKTTLLRRLMATLHPKTPFVFLFNTRLAFDEILAFVCDELRIAPVPSLRVQRIQVLNEFLLRQVREGRTTALLVDEAQNLGDDVLEELRLLSNLETNDEKLLQIALVGQPELDAKLARQELRQLRQRIA
ncbi:MAG: ExeA family protein, partial [Candidatus Binatia bacterium]